MKRGIVKRLIVKRRVACFILLFVFSIFCGSLFAWSGKVELKSKKPYRISGQIRNDYKSVEFYLKNKSCKVITSFTVHIYVSVYDENEDAGWGGFDGLDELYGSNDFGGDDSEAGYELDGGLLTGGLQRFVLRVEERVGGNDRGDFVFPLELEKLSGYFNDEGYRDLSYEIEFIYISEIEYEDGEKWFYKGGN